MEFKDWQPLFLTFKLAGLTTICLFVIALPLSYWLAYSRSKIKLIIEALVSMPLVLPPVVLGYYLLVFTLNPDKYLGKIIYQYFDLKLAFTFEGLVIGSVIFCFPFMVQPLQSGFESLPKSYKEAAYTLGKSKFETLIFILLPNIKPQLITAVILTFAHTIGEFGVVLMIGGSIEGETKVASIAIFEEFQAFSMKADYYSFVLFLISFIILISVFTINKTLKGSHD